MEITEFGVCSFPVFYLPFADRWVTHFCITNAVNAVKKRHHFTGSYVDRTFQRFLHIFQFLPDWNCWGQCFSHLPQPVQPTLMLVLIATATKTWC